MPPTIELTAHLDAQRGRVRGTMRARFTNPGDQPVERVYLWLLPNRMQRPPAGIDDVNHYWIYPSAFNPGSMRVTSARAGAPGLEQSIAAHAFRDEPHAIAGRGALLSLPLPAQVPRGGVVSLELEYQARIPERYGPLGCIDGRCTLMGGFHPMLAALGPGGWDLEGPPMHADMDVHIELARPASLVIFDQVFGQATVHTSEDGVNHTRRGPRVPSARARIADAPYATVFVAPRFFESRRVRDSTTLRYVSSRRPPPTDQAHDQILPYTEENHARYALESALDALALIDSIEAPLMPSDVLMVDAPLRFELASAHPGAIAISDRYYRIWPAGRFRKFHQRQLVRAFFGHLVGRLARTRDREDARDIDMVADLIASYLTDLYELKVYQKTEFMGDILQPVAFIPVVDQLLYAPQTMFAGAYFGNVLDDEVLRDHPRRFMHQRPRGRLIYEKLRDILTAEALRATMRAIIVDGTPYREAAERAYGAPLDWFFRQWDGPYPRTDYRLLGTSSRRAEDGRHFVHEIRVERRTAAADIPPLEPVTVLVVLESGARRTLRWDGRGQVGIIEFESSEAIDRVVVDPARRLVERKLPGDVAHPLFNNRDEHKVRFVYNSFGVLLNISDLSALLAADFSLGRVHDVKHGSRFTVYTSESTLVGLSGRYSRSFGAEITPDRLLSRVTTRLSVQRLKSGFFGADEPTASRVSVGASLGQSDRLFAFEPRFSRDLGIGGTVNITRFDATELGPAEYSVSGSLGVGYVHLSTLGGGHTLGLEFDAAIALGDIRSRSQLTGASGSTGLRGYAPGTLFGRSKMLVRAEYRHVFTHRMNWNLGHYNFLRGIGGAFFLDAGTVSSCERHDLLSRESLYASAGYGIGFFYDSFGTLPQFMRIDVAVPLVNRDRECLGSPLVGGPPVMVYLGFLPPF